ncbi:MAG: HAMP domain-containing protein [Pseudomonadota bacterium]
MFRHEADHIGEKISDGKMHFRYGTKLFLSHLIAVFLVSGSVGTFFYFQAIESQMRSLRSRLQNSAALLSHGINGPDLDAINGPSDIESEVYRRNIDKMRRIRRSNPDIAFLYVMRKEKDRVVFVLDSDETERQAPPGKQYPDVPDSMQKGFFAPSVDDQLFRDEWGVFLSGYAPLSNGEGRYLVGIDMRADEVDQKLSQLRLNGVVSLLASILLALFFARFLSRGLARRIEGLTQRCRQIAAGRFEERIVSRRLDEFDELADAFNSMSDQLGQARTETDKALEHLRSAHDNLENLVEARTRDLQEALDKVSVLRGLLPICCSCKKIRDDQGYWQQVEHFVEAHMDVRFSHGLCPDCAVKLYGDIISPETVKRLDKRVLSKS